MVVPPSLSFTTVTRFLGVVPNVTRSGLFTQDNSIMESCTTLIFPIITFLIGLGMGWLLSQLPKEIN